MLHDPKRRQRRRLLESVPPEFTVQEEPFLKIVDELPPLFVRFGKAHAKSSVDVDWQGLMRMAASGTLRVVTARHRGLLVGFCLTILSYPLMYKSTLFGSTFAVWLDKSHRFGMNGYRLLRRNKEYLLEWGCQKAYIATDIPRLGKVYERLGYSLDEYHYVSMGDAKLRR